MADLYLLSAIDKNGVEQFYTANTEGIITPIGPGISWSEGFDAFTLSCLDNSVFAGLDRPRIYTNNKNLTSATENMTGQGLIWTTDATAINSVGYHGLSKLTATTTGSEPCKFAISFDKYRYWTRGTGTLAASTGTIPTTAAARTSAGITVPTGTENAFDGSSTTVFEVSGNQDVVVTYGTPFVARRCNINVHANCRLPLLVKFSRFDDTTKSWVVLDECIIKVSKNINRYFLNDNPSNMYKWEFYFDPTMFGDDPSKKLCLTNLDIYGQTTGMTWLPCTKAEVATKGMTAATMAALTLDDYAQIFNQSQIDFIAFIPQGSTLKNLVATFPANAAPIVDNVIADRTNIHSGDVRLAFTITDPEGTVCSYSIKVNGKEVATGYNIMSGSSCNIELKNEWLTTIQNLDKPSIPTPQNKITIVAKDEYGASSFYDYYITKTDNLPTYTGILVDDTYTFSIDDANNDTVKYVAFINGKQFASSDFMPVPTDKLQVVIDSDDINIGKDNVLKIMLIDSVGGVSYIEEHFIGQYRSLLFYDEKNVLLSTDKGVALKKAMLNTICCGQMSLPIELWMVNKTSKTLKTIVLSTPGFINDTYVNKVVGGSIVKVPVPGDMEAQIALDDTFLVEETKIIINSLAPNERVRFYIRVVSTNPGAKGGTFDFDITAKSL